MTPANLAAMCALAGLNAVALTDHNSTGNCAAFCQAAERNGLLALPGMELCTREEVHVVCLFPDLECADAFSDYVGRLLPSVPNDREMFGPQILMDSEDKVLGEETRLLRCARAGCLLRRPGLSRPHRPPVQLPALPDGHLGPGAEISSGRDLPALPGKSV